MRFETDGIRGIYGTTLTEQTAFCLAAALGKKGSILLGRDTRPSSPSLARAAACGAAFVGASVTAVGVVTTPALYYLLTQSNCDCAVMITASHNPKEYNGLKVFTREGKLGQEERAEVESEMRKVPGAFDPDFPYHETPFTSPYVTFIKSVVGDLSGARVVVDLARGAGCAFSGLYRRLGATVYEMNADGDGTYINENCGALYPAACAKEVIKRGADLGVAIDGDGDRIIAVDSKGNILDGDLILYLLACRMKKKGLLNKNRIAMTVMTNGGVLKSLTEQGITPVCTAVGDAAVAQAMKAEGLNLGGEQSGHVILGDYLPTGDALLVGAVLLKSILTDGAFDLTPPPKVYPQVLLNVPVYDKRVATLQSVQDAAAQEREALCEGRVLLRASGTENLVRIMVEHPDAALAKKAANRLKEVVLRYSKV